jgi:thiamine-phosphate pyrophosphorylase
VESRPLTQPILCFVTRGRLTPHDAAAIDRISADIRTVAEAGVDLIQIREPRLDGRSLAVVVRAAVDATAGTSARIIVNDRVDVALAAGAAGAHLRADSMAAPDVRPIVPADFLIGRSVHSVEETAAADRAGGCDYLIFGTVFPSGNKPAGHRVAGVDELARACRATRLPLLAIGGISVERAAAVAAAGAAGVAAITLFGSSADVPAMVRAVRRAFDT